MIALICLFLPGVACVWLYEKLTKKDLAEKNWCYLYVLDVLFINIACFLIKKLMLDTAQYSMNDLSPAAALNYLVMALPICGALAYVQSLLKKNAKVTIEDEHNDD